MSFHLGKPILAMLLLAGVSGGMMLLRHPAQPTDLTVWIFAESHGRIYRDALPDGTPSLCRQYQQLTGKSVGVDLIANRALDVRLLSLFMSPEAGAAPPDLVELEIGSVGKFFRPPVDEVGLLPLNDFLDKSGDRARFVASRFAPWSKRGVIFGIPHDLHPVTLTYRKDLFDEAGVDLESVKTWREFQSRCLDFQRYWNAHGHPERHAMELHATQADLLVTLLLQRHINLIDSDDGMHLSDPKVAETMAFYMQLIAGPDQIGTDSSPGAGGTVYRDFADGNLCAMITPDWRAGYLKDYAPEISGKVRMRPLPLFDPGDSPTSTWGGTMVGIPRHAKDPEASWKLLEFLFLSPPGLKARRVNSEILPPIPAAWTDPAYQTADPYFAGQQVNQLYISLANQIPERYVTPFSVGGQMMLTVVLNKAVNAMKENGSQNLEHSCQGWLDDASKELEQWVAQGKFDQ